jgi:hypothetical protein
VSTLLIPPISHPNMHCPTSAQRTVQALTQAFLTPFEQIPLMAGSCNVGSQTACAYRSTFAARNKMPTVKHLKSFAMNMWNFLGAARVMDAARGSGSTQRAHANWVTAVWAVCFVGMVLLC